MEKIYLTGFYWHKYAVFYIKFHLINCLFLICLVLSCHLLLRYVYELEASTEGGTAVSEKYSIQTPSSCPTGIQPPHSVTVLGPRSVSLAWTPPGKYPYDISSVWACCVIFRWHIMSKNYTFSVPSINSSLRNTYIQNSIHWNYTQNKKQANSLKKMFTVIYDLNILNISLWHILTVVLSHSIKPYMVENNNTHHI